MVDLDTIVIKTDSTAVQKAALQVKILRNEVIGVDEAGKNIKLGEGLTKSQASLLAARAVIGDTTKDLLNLADVLRTMNRSTGQNPFDKSVGGLASMRNELRLNQEVSKLMAKDLQLTKGQFTELAREIIRTQDVYESQGKSAEALRSKTRRMISEYAKLAEENNRIVAEAKERDRQLAEQKKQEVQQRIAAEQEAYEKVKAARKLQLQEEDQLLTMRKTMWKDWASGVGKQSPEQQQLSGYYRQLEADATKAYAEAEKASQRNAQVVGRANGYIEREMQKVRYALQDVNKELNKSTSFALVRFENQLKKSGKSLEEQKRLLDEYREGMVKLQKVHNDRQVDYVSRALGPQITDVVVGLSTGQSPLMVLLQQGGQLADQFMLAGVAGENMGAALTESLKKVVSNVKDVAIALGQMFGNIGAGLLKFTATAFTGEGSNIRKLVADYDAIIKVKKEARQLTAALKAEQDLLSSGLGGSAAKVKQLTEELDKKNAILSASSGKLMVARLAITSVALATATAVISVIALGKALYDVIQEETALNRALVLTGGSLGLNVAAANNYVAALQGLGYNGGKVSAVITAMAKEGGFFAREINLVTESALGLQKYGGVAIEDTVKTFSKIKDDPVKALQDFAISSNSVSDSVLIMVESLAKQGRSTEAVKLAMEEMAKVNKEQVNKMKEDYSNLALFFINLGEAISKFYDDVYKSLFRKSDPSQGIRDQIEVLEASIRKFESESDTSIFGAYYRKFMKKDMEDRLNALQKELRTQEDIGRIQTEQGEEQAKRTKRLIDSQKAFNDSLSQTARLQTEITELRNKRAQEVSDTNRPEVLRNYDALIKKKEQELAEASKSKGTTTSVDDIIKGLKQWGDRATNIYDGVIAKVEALNEAEKALRQFQGTTPEGVAQYEAMRRRDPVAVARIEADLAAADAEIRRKKEADQRVKDEKETLDAFERVRREQEKIQKEFEQSARVESEFKKSIGDIELQNRETIRAANADLSLRNDLLGKTEEEARAIKDQYELQGDLAKIQLDYEGQILKINEAKNKALEKAIDLETKRNIERDAAAAIDAAGESRQQRQDAAIKASAMKTAEAQMAEINKFADGISDAISTALFEGGKAGRKKLRDIVVAELQKPIRLVVQAFINPITQAVAGALGFGGGGLAGAAGTSLAGSFAGSASTSALAKMFPSAALYGQQIASGFTTTVSGWFGGTAAQTAAFADIGATTALSSGGASIGSSLASAIPYVAAAALVANALGLMRSDRQVGGGLMGTLGAGDIKEYDLRREGGTLFDGPNYYLANLRASEQSVAIQRAYDAMRQATAGMAEQLGFSGDAIRSFTTTLGSELIHSEVGKYGLTFDGLTTEQAAQKVEQAMATANEELARQALNVTRQVTVQAAREVAREIQVQYLTGSGDSESLAYRTETVMETVQEAIVQTIGGAGDAFIREGESASAALVRLSTSLGLVNQTFDILGYTLKESSILGADAASRLLDAFGGMEEFTKTTEFFFENYYDEAERTATRTRKLTEAFAGLGYALPESRKELRQWIELAQKDTSKEGMQLYAQLSKLAVGFADITPGIDDAVQSFDNFFNFLDDQIAKLLGKVETETGTMAYLSAQNILNETVISGTIRDQEKLQKAIETVVEGFDDRGFVNKIAKDSAALELTRLLNSVRGIAGGNPAGYSTTDAAASLTDQTTTASTLTAPNANYTSSSASTQEERLAAIEQQLTLLRAETRANVENTAKTAMILNRVLDSDTLNVTVTNTVTTTTV